MAETEKKGDGERTVVRGLCFIGIPVDSNSVQVECDDGKIVRIRPLHYDWKYPDLKPWKMEARGKTFSPSMESLIPPFGLGYKNRVYSPNSVLHRYQRVPLLVGGVGTHVPFTFSAVIPVNASQRPSTMEQWCASSSVP